MSQNKPDKKPLNRKSRIEKTTKDSNAEKEKKLTDVRKTIKDEKYRSGSLNRSLPGPSRESPRKSQSVDRRSSNSVGIPNLKKEIKSTKNIVSVVNKKPSTNVKSTTKRQEVSNDDKSSRKSHTSSQKISSSSKSSQKKNSERRTNAQIAKSFVQNASSKPVKHSELQKSVSKAPKRQGGAKKAEENLNLARPRTSTIRKEPPTIVDDINDEEEEVTETKLNKNSISRSRNSLKAESEDERASYEDDFEDYNSDFEESGTDSVSDTESSYSSIDQQEEMLADFEAENADYLIFSSEAAKLPVVMDSNTELFSNKNNGEKMYLKMSDRSSLYPEKEVDKSSERKSVKRSFINFASAVEREDESKISLEKSMNNVENELYTAIDKSNVAEVLSMNSTYHSRSNFNSKQVYVQTENCEAEETQTEEINVLDKWTQNPVNSTIGYGGDEILPTEDKSSGWKLLFNPHSVKLSSFLQRSSHIILTLFDEEFSSSSDESSMRKRRQDFFHCDGYYLLSPLTFLKDVPIASIYSSPSASPYILTIHGNMIKIPSSIEGDEEKGIICVWNVFNSNKPEHILISNSQPICATFGPGGSDIVIAGMVDGAVMLWDLTNFNSNVSIEESGNLLPLLSSTYNTAIIFGSENHSSCIVGINAVFNHAEVGWKSNSTIKTNYTRNFHVLTLEEMGVINVWVVVEVLKPDISGTETDLGLAPGGKYRLVRSSCIHLQSLTSLQREQKVNMRTFDFRLIPQDSSRLLVTTDIGLVLHVTRHAGTPEPRFYSNQLELTYEVRCIDCSPHNKDLFLIGCSDGSMKLYNIKIVRPLMEFLCTENGESVNHLQWSTIHPAVFFVLSSSSKIHLWNLIEDSLHPIQSCHFQDSKITWFVLQTIEKRSNQSASDKNLNFLVSKENGELEVHAFRQKLTNEEYDKQWRYMEGL